jgi:pyruvate/2-oxoglutarate dehydrogenase complex dihydrolipoamide acyltransferase (E2) component
MDVSVVMPQLGNEIEEAQVAQWLKAEGDQVKAGEALLVIETPKVTIDIEAPTTGVLRKILVAVDDLASVGAELAIIEAAAS